eukprot:scaffold3348_cov379-Prasinococcus_capsulatus_cf.AAC.3
MEVFATKQEMKNWARAQRALGKRIGFVPTMGYLHKGHLSLMRIAKSRCDVLVASVYVNPTQFAPHEDLDTYPRDTEGDLAKLRDVGCDAVFMPPGV